MPAMQILVVAGFVVAMSLMPASGPDPAPPAWWLPALLAAGYVAVAYSATRLTAGLGLRRLMRSQGGPPRLGKVPVALALATQVYLVAGLAGLMLLGWGDLVFHRLALGAVPLAPKVLAVAPFVLALCVHWWTIYPLQRALRMQLSQDLAMAGEPVPRTWSRGEFLGLNIRHSLLFVAVPAGAIVLMLDILAWAQSANWLGSDVAGVIGVLASGCVLLLAPAAIVRIWRAYPLPAGPLRAELDDRCRRMKLTCREILVWQTGGTIANAGVMGLIGPVRYVLLSDVLLERMDDEQVEAIFAHEAGHVACRHIPYM
ncbi:hypothetical protein LCGC14_2297500, partial [marine sediment metagenome]